MRAGKIASLILLVVFTAISMAVIITLSQSGRLEAMSALQRMSILAGVLVLSFACFLVPLGFVLDRSIAALRRHIDAMTADKETATAFPGPKWLRPITVAFSGAVHQFQRREQALRNQLRDLEIRHRVTEAERRQIEAVLHSLRDGVVVTDAFNEVVMVNEAAANILGFDVQAAIHQPIDDLIEDKDVCRLISDARATGNTVERRHVEQEIRTRNQGGEPENRVYDITLTCAEDHKHEVSGVVTILHDQTHEHEVSQMKTDFVSKASHELRTPLSSIRAYIEMLVDGEAVDESSRQEFYRIIQNEAERLGRLIDNMLNISRIEAGIIQIEREQVDLTGLIERAMSTLEPQAREKKITLNTKIAPVDLTVEGDPDMLYQVVLNLLSNAVKYTPDGGRVTVAADSDNLTRSVLVTVSDTGLGIPPDALPKLFDKFFRIENYKRVAKGTGLGLSLCKHIVETLHRGQIGVDSKLGMGSKFWFSVPMRYAGSQAAA